jgi:spore coat polysaccharide biosynthesis predicted glycosyltransferase SpsG
MKIIFRVDANNVSGFGHFSRCINLCRTWKTFAPAIEAEFLGNYEEFAIKTLQTYQIAYTPLESPDFSTLLSQSTSKPDLAVFDSYLISQSQLDQLASYNFKSLIVDDSCTLNFEGIFGVLNFRLDANNLYRYNAKHSFLGIEFLVVKPEIVNLRAERRILNDKAESLLLSTGGMLTGTRKLSTIVDCIREISAEIKISHIGHVCLGRTDNYHHFFPNPHIEKYFAECDVALNTGGLIKYESSFSLVPTASFSTTPLQLYDSKILDARGIHYDLGDLESASARNPPPLLADILLRKECRSQLVQNSRSYYHDNPTLHLVKQIEKVL